MNDNELLREIHKLQESGRLFVLAMIVRTAGSSPRSVGARMVVFPDGSIRGTIGGGKLEALVIEDALSLIESDGRHLLKKYRFSKEGKDAIGMSCGGEAELFLEQFSPPERLVIFGAGHIGRELARLATGSGFALTLVDDRPETLSDLEQSVTPHQAGTEFKSNLPEVDGQSYVVIVTRGHDCDRRVLKEFITRETAYLGMMGSKAKIARIFNWLKEGGASDESLERVHTPIGLSIDAEGPYEIALSIMAELIAVRNGTADRSNSA